MASGSEEVENFYGVYLLFCINPQYQGHTYIGFTVDPNRRIKQHNGGVRAGGAHKTSKKGPWEMVMIVHGFPNDISALRFEWAWTYPARSRRLKSVGRKASKESKFDFCLRVVGTMLRTRPWSRLPLTIRWLKPEFQRPFPTGLEPPTHIPIVFGLVKCTKVKIADDPLESEDTSPVCSVCHQAVNEDVMRCLVPACKLKCHLECLARHFLRAEPRGTLLPLEGTCPLCEVSLLWGDLIRLKKGCYQLQEESEDADHWSGLLSQVTKK